MIILVRAVTVYIWRVVRLAYTVEEVKDKLNGHLEHHEKLATDSEHRHEVIQRRLDKIYSILAMRRDGNE